MFETKSKNYFVVWELAFKCETNCVTQQMISGERQIIRHFSKMGVGTCSQETQQKEKYL